MMAMPDQSTSRILIIESGDDFRAVAVPADWDLDDIDRYLNGMAYGRAAVVTLDEPSCECEFAHQVEMDPNCGRCGFPIPTDDERIREALAVKCPDGVCARYDAAMAGQ